MVFLCFPLMFFCLFCMDSEALSSSLVNRHKLPLTCESNSAACLRCSLLPSHQLIISNQQAHQGPAGLEDRRKDGTMNFFTINLWLLYFFQKFFDWTSSSIQQGILHFPEKKKAAFFCLFVLFLSFFFGCLLPSIIVHIINQESKIPFHPFPVPSFLQPKSKTTS
jgi:hypothetical protein